MDKKLLWGYRLFSSIWCASVLTIIFYNGICYLNIPGGGINNNLLLYGITILSFFTFLLICYLVFIKLELILSEIYLKVFFIILCLVTVILLYVCWQNETLVANSPANNFLWHSWPDIVVFTGLISFFLLYHFMFKNLSCSIEKKKFCMAVFYITIIVTCGYTNYYLEYLSADYYHGNAVFNSVFNVFHGAPYDELCNSIYGNYAIFLALPMKLLGNGEYFDFSRLMCLLTMVCVSFCIYIIHNLIRDNKLKILCIAALAWPFIFREKNYWQVWPLRTLWPVLFMAWLTFSYNRRSYKKWPGFQKIFFPVSYLFVSLAIVWNKESGITCLLSYFVFSFMNLSCQKERFKALLSVVLEWGIMLTSVLFAYFIVGSYNLFAAGKWVTWNVFLFPLLTKSYMTDILMIKLESGIWPWMLNACLFLAVLGTAMIRKFSKNNKHDKKWGLYAACAAEGLILMTYFMNRAAYPNLDICFFQAVICIGIVGSLNHEEYGALITNFIKGISGIILLALIMGEILQLGQKLYLQKSYNVFERGEILQLKAAIEESVEPDTYAFGYNVPELYSILGWDKGNYTIDWADEALAYEQIRDKIYHDLNSKKYVITDKEVIRRNEDIKKYMNQFYYIDQTFTYAQNEVVEFYLWRQR